MSKPTEEYRLIITDDAGKVVEERLSRIDIFVL